MSKLIDEAEYLTIGRFTFDVSNVSMIRKIVARRAHDELALRYDEEKIVEQTEEMQKLIEKYGLYMIRQKLSMLRRRLTLKDAIKSYIQRYLLTRRYIYDQTEPEYQAFEEWAYFNITGRKKKDQILVKQIQEMEKMALEEINKISTDPEKQRILLQTFLQETAGRMNL